MNLPRVTFPGKFTLVTDATVAVSCTTMSGSTTVTMADTTAINGAVGVSGTGIAAGTYVSTVASATTITLTQAATASGTATLTFALEPVTLAEAKLHLRVTTTAEDGYIANLITAARRRAESHLDRSFLTKTWDYTLETFPTVISDTGLWMRVQNVIVIPKAPLIAVTTLSYIDLNATTQTLVQGTDYSVRTGDPGAVYPYPLTRVWPYTRYQLDAVTIRFTAGYGSLATSTPATIKQAILMIVGHLYRNREDVTDYTAVVIPRGADYLLDSESWGSRV